MGHPRDTNDAIRRDPAAAAVIRAWRSLTGGSTIRDNARRTLIACSGGADSGALVAILAAATTNLVIAHIVHDLRPTPEAHADRDTAQAFTNTLGLPFVQATVAVKGEGGNAEAAARRLRYRELARLAAENACPFLATAHHGDDLLETMLMRLMRGAGPRGLVGIRPRRRLAGGTNRNGEVVLIRPMLGITRADAQRLCTLAGFQWSTDKTNTDLSRLRNAVRASVVPELRRLSPLIAERAAVTSSLLAGAAEVIERQATAVLRLATVDTNGEPMWPRKTLRHRASVVLGEVLRLASARITNGWGQDQLSRRVVLGAVEAIKDDSTDPRRFEWSGVVVEVTANAVNVKARS